MGLDCYWTKPNESKSQPLDFDPPLCIEDEHDRRQRRKGWAHFRGRTFEDAIQQITGVSLRAYLDNATVGKIAERLEAFAVEPWPLPPSEILAIGWEAFSSDEYRDLARLFRTYAAAGYELRGSW